MKTNANILLATPCYGNQITNAYFLSVIKTIATFSKSDINLNVYTHGNESLITRARNICCAVFLSDPSYTHILFIDSDIGFEPVNIIRLLSKNEGVVCSPYPQKKFYFDRIRNGDDSLVNFNIHVSANNEPCQRQIVNGFMEVDRAATGFMLIKREVFQKIMKECPQLQYKSCDNSEKHIENFLWRFFDCSVDKNNFYMSEDYAFCDLWKTLGGKIWIDTTARLTHVGTAEYSGDFMKSKQ